MNGRKLPDWLMLAAIAAGILGNAVIVILIFRIQGIFFVILLPLYTVAISTVCAWLLRKKEIRHLSAELQISEEEVLQRIQAAKKEKRSNNKKKT